MSAIAVDPLIAEAKRRARRRRVYVLAILAAAVVGAVTYALLPRSAPSRPVTGTITGASPVRVRGVGDVGSSGGVTWAMNGHGVWLTSNRGRAWRKVSPPRGTGFIERQGSSVQFVDRQHGWISLNEITGYWPNRGGRWMFARTTDGGRTWQPSFPADCRGRCGGGSMSFLDARHGFLLAYGPDVGPNELFRTADGGQTWQPVAKASVFGPITFVDSRVGFAFGTAGPLGMGPGPAVDAGRLYRTTDGGRTWSLYAIDGSTSWARKPVARVGHRLVVVQTGPNLAPKRIYVSADGRAWSGRAVPHGVAWAATFAAASSNAWAFAWGSDVVATADAGRHWREIGIRRRASRFQPALWSTKVAFTSSQAGWVVLGHTLYRTTDGGLHWAVTGPAKGKPIAWPACSPARLETRVWSSNSRLRHGTALLEFVNTGRLACWLSGWPTVVAVTDDGNTVRFQPSQARPVRKIFIGSAYAALHASGVRPGSGSASCPKATALRVTLPGGHRATTLPGPWTKGGSASFNFPLCGAVTVTPVYRW